MGLIIKQALGDSAITFLWAIYITCMRPSAVAISSTFGIQGYEFYIISAFLALNVFFFSWLGTSMGGCLWNPTPVMAFYTIGVSNDSLFTMPIRFLAQAFGAVGGVHTARELVPSSYKHLLGGPHLKVNILTGVLAELGLTFAIMFAVLFAILKGPKSTFWKNWIIIFATITLVVLGSEYTGPAMNPANAFAWAYMNQGHYSIEHLIVYWVAPLFGSFIASCVFGFVFFRNYHKEKSE